MTPTTLTIRSIRAWEILDSRGNSTIAVEAELSDGAAGQAHVPAGASTGRHEAKALEAGAAVACVNSEISSAIAGLDAGELLRIEEKLMLLDGTADKSRLGANSILGVACAVARALSVSRGKPLWQVLREVYKPLAPANLPLPMINILSGGLHAGGAVDFQDFLVVPHGFASVREALRATVAIHRAAKREIEAAGYAVHGVADEGGWGPPLPSNEEALKLLSASIRAAGFDPGRQVSIALDVAASHFYNASAATYQLRCESRALDAPGMCDLIEAWVSRHAILSVEDALAEDDWDGWRVLTARLGDRLQLVGDDLFTTNERRVDRGISSGAANSVLVKMNQIGSLSETFAVVERAQAAGYSCVVSARSGETEDNFLADLAIATGAGQIKVGSITRSERLAKYNRLLELEGRGGLPFAGSTPLARWIV